MDVRWRCDGEGHLNLIAVGVGNSRSVHLKFDVKADAMNMHHMVRCEAKRVVWGKSAEFDGHYWDVRCRMIYVRGQVIRNLFL